MRPKSCLHVLSQALGLGQSMGKRESKMCTGGSFFTLQSNVEPHSRCQHISAHHLHAHIELVLEMLPWILALACVTPPCASQDLSLTLLIHRSKICLRAEELKCSNCFLVSFGYSCRWQKHLFDSCWLFDVYTMYV